MKFMSRKSRLSTSLAFIFALLSSTFIAPAPAIAIGAPMVLQYEFPNWRPIAEFKLMGNVNVQIDWGDGNVENAVNAGHYQHNFGTPGVHTITITGTLDQFGNGLDWAYSNFFLQRVTSFGDLGLKSLNGAFVNANGLTEVPSVLPSTVTNLGATFWGSGTLGSNIASWDTSNVTDMSSTFREARNFNEDIGDWNTSNVTTMTQMFYITDLFNQDISGWNTSNVTDMSNMFNRSWVFNQDISSWDVSKVTNFAYMFADTSMFNQNIGSWNTSAATNLGYMFISAQKFNQDISSWDVSHVTEFQHMFHNAGAFNSPLNAWNTSAAIYMQGMFQGYSVFNQPLNSWNVGNVVDMQYMFADQSAFNQSLNSWDVSNVKYFHYMFVRNNVFNGDISDWNTTEALSMEGMFQEARAFNSDISGWDTSKVVSFMYMFLNADSFNQPIGSWNTSSAINMEQMFFTADMFNQDISAWDVSNVQNMRHMFRETLSFNQSLQAWHPTSLIHAHAMFFGAQAYNQPLVENPNGIGWTTASVIDMSYMFANTLVFNQDVSSWHTGNVTSMARMFESAREYDQPMVASYDRWDTSKVTDFSGMFAYAQKFNQNISSWDTSSAQWMQEMFRNAAVYNQPLVSSAGHWNTSNVESMERMFWGTPVFNQDLDTWDTGKVRNFIQMFAHTEAFNGQINSWDMRSALYVYEMFNDTFVFNQPLNNWDFDVVEQMQAMFYASRAFNQPIDNWDTGTVYYMQDMFNNAQVFNQDISNWDVSHVQYFYNMFYNADDFDQDFVNWDTSSAVSMEGMFNGADSFNSDVSSFDLDGVDNICYMFAHSNFNQPIGNWDVHTVQHFCGTFLNNPSFNQDISQWDVSNAWNFSVMFQNSNFNMPIDDWDVSRAYYFNAMFAGNTHFNQPIYKWNTANAHEMGSMFRWAYAFDQDVSQWDIEDVYYMNEILHDSGISMNHWSRFVQKISDTSVHQWRSVSATQYVTCATQTAREHIYTHPDQGGLGWGYWDYGVTPDCKTDQSIDFTQPDDFAVNKSRTLDASATSELEVEFMWLSGPCEVDGNVVTATAEGTCVVAANQNGDSTFYDATQVVRWFDILPTADPDVIYNANGATSGTAPVDADNPHAIGSDVTLKTKGDLARTDAIFTGWNTKADGSGDHYDEGEVVEMPYRDLVLFAEWFSLTPHMVDYNSNGADSGTPPLGATYSQGNTVTVLDNTDMVKEHHHFVGWTTNQDGTGDFYEAGDTFIMGSEAVTLWAKWALNDQYSVTYFGNGAEGGSVPTDSNVYFEGDEFTVQNHDALTREHYHFIGWTTNEDGSGDFYEPGDTFTVGNSGDISLYAQWELDGAHSVTYDRNGADAGTDPDDPTRYLVGDSVTVLGIGDLAWHGFHFVEWNTQADGEGDSFQPGDFFTHPDEDVVLYAIWEEDPTFTLSYDITGADTGTTPDSETEYQGDVINVAACNAVKAGFTCDGWNTAQDGTGITYRTGDHFTLGDEDAVLYPHWVANPLPPVVAPVIKKETIQFGNYGYWVYKVAKTKLKAFYKKYLKGRGKTTVVTVTGLVQHSSSTLKGKKLPAPVVKFNTWLQKQRCLAVINYLKSLGAKVTFKIRIADSKSSSKKARVALISANLK